MKIIKYKSKYFSDIVSITKSNWNLNKYLKNQLDDNIIYKNYVKHNLSWSNFTLIIVDENDVARGIICITKENLNILEHFNILIKRVFYKLWKNHNYKKGYFGVKENFDLYLKDEENQNLIGEQYEELFDAEIGYLAISSDFRKRGYGTQLVNEAMNYCRKNKFKEIFVYSTPDSDYQFYDRYGFYLYKIEKYSNRIIDEDKEIYIYSIKIK